MPFSRLAATGRARPARPNSHFGPYPMAQSQLRLHGCNHSAMIEVDCPSVMFSGKMSTETPPGTALAAKMCAAHCIFRGAQ
jgi:hypothetical protein